MGRLTGLRLESSREEQGREEGAPTFHLDLDLIQLISEGKKKFFDNPALSDITLLCPDGRTIYCHSVILAAASQRFADVLTPGSWVPGQQLPVEGVDSDALFTLIRAFYTCPCPVELERVPALYDAAIKLEVGSLASALEQFVGSALSADAAVPLLQRCLGLGVDALADVVLGWIRDRAADVLPSPEFRTCPLEAAALICKTLAQRNQMLALQSLRGGDGGGADAKVEELLGSAGPAGFSLGALAGVGDPEPSRLPSRAQIISALRMARQLGAGPLPNVSPVQEHGTGPGGPLALPPAASLAPGPGVASAGLGPSDDRPAEEWHMRPNPSQEEQGDVDYQAGAAAAYGRSPLLDGGGSGSGGFAGADDRVSGGTANTGVTRSGGGGDNSGGAGSRPETSQPSSLTATGRQSIARGICTVEGCGASLLGLRSYYQRHKTCEFHAKADTVMKDGRPHRFCQQCGRLQPLTEFDGAKRSCRATLLRHCMRRAQQMQAGAGEAAPPQLVGRGGQAGTTAAFDRP
ncbi:hypothetical protein GPECTOR_29g35 [Gonium pectorale]|uniref:BTB domain-containing protein n=1 Tax=Gonium pectorale TaxID=33097 RepID=A0A150GEK1_GONPE|nr:hypothetical protein GPECTOR_29g35 [Gonium pectorale]|eukprot:KXZ48256.1 hypothetical protein GPECTOR_29g35 [Gonium pectorale]